MEEKGVDKVMAFDTLFTTNRIQMFKVLLTYMDPSAQKNLAVYIKLMELQYTISFFKQHPNATLHSLPQEDNSNTSKLCDELLPLCTAEQRGKILQMKNVMQTFENMQGMMEMMQMMKEFFPEGTTSSETGTADLLSGLTGMFNMPDLSGMDISQLFQMSQMFQSSEASDSS